MVRWGDTCAEAPRGPKDVGDEVVSVGTGVVHVLVDDPVPPPDSRPPTTGDRTGGWSREVSPVVGAPVLGVEGGLRR